MNMYKGDLRALIVEDNTSDANLCLHELKIAGFNASADVVDTAREFGQRLRERAYDVILADYRIPGWSGMEALLQLMQMEIDIPFIVVTGALGDEAAVQCIKAGASDYILKDRLARLPQAVFQLMEEKKLRQASKAAQQMMVRQAAELETARERRFQMKSEFLDHVSHELRTPIAAACMFLTNTLDGLAGTLKVEQQDWLEKTLSNLRELNRMVDELLAVTRVSLASHAFSPYRTSLADSASQACAMLQVRADSANIRLIISIPPDLPLIHADPKYMQQILNILIENALKSVGDNGAITVSGEVFDLNPGFVRVSVADTGGGIDEENLSTVFEHFYQPPNAGCPSRQGLSIGLHVCEELVAHQGGRIWVESPPNQGSTFLFTLPLSDRS